nr:hypothetical protein [Mediterraneibacter glycyrrhizinilyticus]
MLCVFRDCIELSPYEIAFGLSKGNPPEGPAGRISAVTSGLI